MFSEAILGSNFLAESATDTVALCPEVAEITLESALDITGDPFEYAIQSMYEFKMNLQAIDTIAVCEEYAYLKTNGVEMVNEAAKETIKAWFTKVKESIIKFGKKIAAFFKKIMSDIDQRINGDKAFLKKYEDKINDLGTVKLNKAIKAYTFDNMLSASEMQSSYNLITQNVLAAEKYAEPGSGSYKTMHAQTSDTISKQVITVYAAKQGIKECSTLSEFKEAFIKEIRGKEQYIEMVDVKKLAKQLESSYSDKKMLEAAFKNNKSTIDNALKRVNLLQKQCEQKTIEFEAARIVSTVITNILNLLTTVNNVYTQAFDARRRTYRKLITAAINQSKKDTVDESGSLIGSFELY